MCMYIYVDYNYSLTHHVPCVSAVCGAVLQGSLFGMVGLLPPRYSTLFMSGQGLAGIFAALAMLFSILGKHWSSSQAKCIFFFISSLVI